MKKPVNPYESGDAIKSTMALHELAMNSDVVIYVGGTQSPLREVKHDIYLIDGQAVILLLPSMWGIDVEFALEVSPE